MTALPRLLFLLAYVAATLALSAEAEKPWPLWDGQESVTDYARRVNLPQTLELGNGVKLELVLVPAGECIMGTPEPEPVDEEGFRRKILIGQVLLAASGGVLLVLLGAVVAQAIRQRRRPQYSLARFLAMIVAGGAGALSGVHWWQSAQTLEKAKTEYQAALARNKDSDDSEKPAHKVTVTIPFYLGKCEVTQEQYHQVMRTNPSQFIGHGLPVENVSWDDAQEFCKNVSHTTGQTVRLPTDAEWEYACRAGTKTVYHTGDTDADLARAGWYYGNSKNTTHLVGEKTSNAWGVFDMHGNVWEWCQDGYEPYEAAPLVDPQGAPQGKWRLLRGGSWNNPPMSCRSAFRRTINPGYREDQVGFRVVVVVSLGTR